MNSIDLSISILFAFIVLLLIYTSPHLKHSQIVSTPPKSNQVKEVYDVSPVISPTVQPVVVKPKSTFIPPQHLSILNPLSDLLTNSLPSITWDNIFDYISTWSHYSDDYSSEVITKSLYDIEVLKNRLSELDILHQQAKDEYVQEYNKYLVSKSEFERQNKEFRKHIEDQLKLFQTPLINEDRETSFRQLLSEYSKFHDRMMKGKEKPYFLHCRPINGYGNIFQEAVSCFLTALYTNRALVTDFKSLEGYLNMSALVQSTGNINHLDHSVIGQFEEIEVDSTTFMCIDFDAYKDKPSIVVRYTFDYFAYALFANPLYKNKLFLPSNWYSIAFSYLFEPLPELKERIKKYKDENFGEFTVGIQIRAPTQAVTKTGEMFGPIDHKGKPVPPVSTFIKQAEELTRLRVSDPNIRKGGVKWYVATQNLEVYEEIKKAYPERVIFYHGKITTTFDNDHEGKVVSLITWWLLMECDEVITTEVSSYGVTAAVSSGIIPVTCTHEAFCFRKIQEQPCQVTPMIWDQPMKCLNNNFFATENSCSYFNLVIGTDKRHKDGTW